MGYALLKAKSSKILKQDGFAAEDETAEGICSLYVNLGRLESIEFNTNSVVLVGQCQVERLS